MGNVAGQGHEEPDNSPAPVPYVIKERTQVGRAGIDPLAGPHRSGLHVGSRLRSGAWRQEPRGELQRLFCSWEPV